MSEDRKFSDIPIPHRVRVAELLRQMQGMAVRHGLELRLVVVKSSGAERRIDWAYWHDGSGFSWGPEKAEPLSIRERLMEGRI